MHRIAVYGLEGHEETIFDAVAKRDDAVLVAVASKNKAALDSLKNFPAVTAETNIYPDWPEMLESEEMDVLAICSENDKHVQPIVAASERGINIITEKPISVDREGLDDIRESICETGVAFSVLFDMRMGGAYIAMRDAVRAGAIGKPVLIFAQKSYRLGDRPDWMKHRSSLGGVIPYIGCHMLDLAMWITGLDVVRVSGFHGNTCKNEILEMEDHAVLSLQMTHGAAMSLTLDYLRPMSAPTHGDARLRIAGSQGVIEIKDLESRVELIADGKPPRDLPLAKGGNLFDDFLDSLDGKKPHVIAPNEIFRVTEILLTALEAADCGTMLEA